MNISECSDLELGAALNQELSNFSKLQGNILILQNELDKRMAAAAAAKTLKEKETPDSDA